MDNNVKGKVVVITGATSGIGEATARLLAQNGAKLSLAARTEARVNALVNELKGKGAEVIGQAVDVQQYDQVKTLIENTLDTYGRVDVLYNNAGVMPIAPLRDGKLSDWNQMIDTNLKGVLYGIKEVLPIMEKQKSGQIIATDSVAGHVVSPNYAVYNATKFAVRALMEGVRQEESADHNIRATIVSPGAVETNIAAATSDQQLKAQVTKNIEDYGMDAGAVAQAVLYAIAQPEDISVNEVLIRPTAQH
ncbi:short-chain dehydrogenase reductase SDR [Lactobacillus selangorensis]|uniref:Short-chain dehydrogenase reductase SDR n=1 Tax=Lactobacillus selangorensis TaxID=81857 RepID=A0A0R2FLT6_9LACO|nr:SDR family oxidoreductase [Lactobacillus selangorensis]KRN29577.1 short-chain dehydrogenase reductase SDR [Lactobacillus selangorensis]KRN33893.1 short-chain dehydrogenase reductase SDR [Lactobacillus selangorensis]